MSLTEIIFKFVTGRSAKRFEALTHDPATAQREKLLLLMERNANTEYGKRYNFGSIKSAEDFSRNVPIITYDTIKDDMDRVVDGAKNVFTAEDPILFAQTSGTTGDPKFLPVTESDYGREHSDQMRTWLNHAQRVHPDIYDGKIVSLVSPAIEGHTSCGLPYGSTSGHIYKNMPGLITRGYSIPYDVFEISDYAAKYYAIMRISLEHDVRFLCTANPSSILKMCEKANEHGDAIIRDIRDGTLSSDFMIEPEIRKLVEAKLRPNPRRAKMLEDARDLRRGILKPGDYWSRLSLIGCWKGGTVGHYLEKFPGWFNPDDKRDVAVRDWGYLASEARGSIPLSDDGSQGVLTIGTNYFEFVAVDELETKQGAPDTWQFLGVRDIEEGKEYYVFFTTTSGLYRYDINDVIKVTGRYNNTPQIVFLRKGRGMTNITGEKVSVNQIIVANQNASKATGAVPAHFKAEADPAGSRYVFRVEFASMVGPEVEGKYLQSLDKELKAINIEYKAKRDSQRLHAPVLHVMREGWYEKQRREQVASGKRMFQAKTELLSPMKQATMNIQSDLLREVTMPAGD